MNKVIISIGFIFISLITFGQTQDKEIEQKLRLRTEQSYRNSINRRPTYIQYNFINPVYNPYRTFNYTTAPVKSDLKPFSIGLSSSYSAGYPVTVGAYFTIKGEELMFLMSMEASSSPSHPYYNNIDLQYIEYWNDVFVGTETRVADIGIGLGKNIQDKYFPYLTFSILNYRQYLVYFDETYILSSTGKYVIAGSYSADVNLGIGFLYEISIVEFKAEVDIIRQNRINLGIGIQL